MTICFSESKGHDDRTMQDAACTDAEHMSKPLVLSAHNDHAGNPPSLTNCLSPSITEALMDGLIDPQLLG